MRLYSGFKYDAITGKGYMSLFQIYRIPYGITVFSLWVLQQITPFAASLFAVYSIKYLFLPIVLLLNFM